MTGVPRHIAEQRLNIREGCPPVRQKRKSQVADRNQAIQEEVEKLVDANIMKEVYYHSWLSNPVMVKKHDDSWRMCVDFKDLNKACPKDGYPLPEIDWKVESLCGFPFKCFQDAYKGYHQIKMAKEDEEKTTFIKIKGVFCYSKMPFGLRNAGATYERLVDKAFHKQIAKNLEVYVDDLVIKSRTEDEIIRDIEETFKTLREINMKLNPKKCTFGVEEGMFLGYKVNTKGIKVCSDKVDAVLSLSSPKCLKDIHKLNRKLASLNRFLAKSAEKSLPLYKTLKKCTKKSDFHWTEEAEAAFKQMKQLIAELPTLTAPEEKEELIVYLAATKEAVSAVLMTEREAKQMPIYFVSRTLRADFIVERPEEDDPDTAMDVEEELPEPWTLFMDGLSCADSFGAGLILTSLEGAEFTYALRFRFEATYNEAEYEALIAGLRITEEMGVKNLQANADSRLVANQVNGTYIAKEAYMIRYLEKVRTLTKGFRMFLIKQVPRIVEEEGNAWMTPIYEYLTEETLSAEVNKARAVRRKSQWFAVINGILYKKSFLRPWLRCVGPLQANYVLREIHEGSCSMHVGMRSVVAKALRTGYYWSTMHKDARELIRAYQDCQWGIDIAGPFPEGPVKVKFPIVAINYFTEWIKAKPVATITDNQVKKIKWVSRKSKLKLRGRDQGQARSKKQELDGRNLPSVIPAKIGMPTLRTTKVDMVQNNKALGINLDLLEERREQAAIHEAKSKAKMEKILQLKGPQHKLQARRSRVP
ncbi:reverse transcriptase domain-containing protein [Tanacetum coccineum]